MLESRRPGALAPGPLSLMAARRTLTDLIAPLAAAEVRGDAGARPDGLAYRADLVAPGWLFFCVPGGRHDGHDFARDAVAAGATAVVVERWLDLPENVAQVLVPSVREAMGPIAAEFHGRPADALRVVGITGTNGKTTITYLLEGIFTAAGLTAGVVGTTGVRVAGRPAPQSRTTPEAPDLHALFVEMVEAGIGAVAMEVSSHGLVQHRVGGVRFDCAVFTNLSQDHLDFHGTIEEYFRAKAMLFDPARSAAAAVNADVPEGRRLLRPDLPAVTYGLGDGADLRATGVRVGADGVWFEVDGVEIHSPLRGAFNVLNSLAAIAAARVLGIGLDDAARGLASVAAVPGRLEPVSAGQDFLVVVDYAHTPDSVENVLRAARPLADGGRVLVVLGCGGDRDRGKRPLMGEAATRLADLTVVTSDNPRSEDPDEIIAEIEPGAKRGGGAYVVEPDRRAAIRLVLAEAHPGDVVIVAGKGHETGQELADRTIPFDDREVAREELAALGRGAG